MAPLHRACAAANIPCETHAVHGAIVESVIRVAQNLSSLGFAPQDQRLI